MLADPFNFEPFKWLHDNTLDAAISKTNWAKHISLVKKQQQVVCNNMLVNKSGMKEITRDLIEQSLSPDEIKIYDSWDGYQVIVNHLNQVPLYSFDRPHKLTNLMLVGRPNIGKTALARKIRDFVAVYSFGVSNWFPRYQN